MDGRERLAVEEGTDEQHERGRDVLEEPHARERNASRPGTEEQQRNNRHDAGSRQQPGDPRPGRSERACSGIVASEQMDERDRREHGELHEQTHDRVETADLLHEPVEAEAEGQSQAHPRNPSVAHGKHEHAGSREEQRDELRRSQPLAKHDDAQEDTDERVDVVPQARLHESLGAHGPRVDEPVDPDDDTRAGRDQQRPPVADRFGELATL